MAGNAANFVLGSAATLLGVVCVAKMRSLRSDQEDLSSDLQVVLRRAAALKQAAGGSRVTLEHLLAALGESDGVQGLAAARSQQAAATAPAEGLSKKDLEDTMRQMLQPPGMGDDQSALERFCLDLTAEARRGKLDPVIGRDDEIRRAIQILSRRTKNNPVLIGETGVGKTAVVQGLAQRISAGDVPFSLSNTTIMELDVGSLTAGCMMPGEFEERLKAVLNEVAATRGRTILFIDDIHNLVPSAVNPSPNQMDGSGLLKPALSRGDLRCIATSTLDKYKKTVERDPALERRFQQVMVEQPSVEVTISILRGLRQRYEMYHTGVTISEAALIAAAQLSHRYISNRFLPDKAIDLIDEATAQVKMEMALKPEAMDALDRKVKQLTSEQSSLQRKSSNDKVAAGCLAEVEDALFVLREARGKLQAEMDVETERRKELEDLAFQVGKLRYEHLTRQKEQTGEEPAAAEQAAGIRAQLQEAVEKLSVAQESARRLAVTSGGRSGAARDEVTESDIARIISKWTGIPVTKLMANEKEKLLHLTDELHKRIIGQSEAVDAVAEAIQRARADLADPNGPIASFMFLGPTGVGKTELAKALAAALFNAEDALIRLDMSEYMEKHSVSRLIGAPPGYVGYDEGGLLTEAVRRRPYAVVLFDEIEKAHVDVFNILLQILDDGRVTDTQGRLVNFKNTLIIMTSNLGSAEIFDAVKSDSRTAVRDKVMEHVRTHFRPEFVNRIDDFITFDPLQPEQIKQIVKLRAQRLVDRMSEKRMKLELAESAVEYLARKGYDPVYGARPVKRALQKELQTLLAQALLHGRFEEDDTVVVESAGGEGEGLTLRRVAGDPAALKRVVEAQRAERRAKAAEQEPQQASSAPKPRDVEDELAASAAALVAGSRSLHEAMTRGFMEAMRPGSGAAMDDDEDDYEYAAASGVARLMASGAGKVPGPLAAMMAQVDMMNGHGFGRVAERGEEDEDEEEFEELEAGDL